MNEVTTIVVGYLLDARDNLLDAWRWLVRQDDRRKLIDPSEQAALARMIAETALPLVQERNALLSRAREKE